MLCKEGKNMRRFFSIKRILIFHIRGRNIGFHFISKIKSRKGGILSPHKHSLMVLKLVQGTCVDDSEQGVRCSLWGCGEELIREQIVFTNRSSMHFAKSTRTLVWKLLEVNGQMFFYWRIQGSTGGLWISFQTLGHKGRACHLSTLGRGLRVWDTPLGYPYNDLDWNC